MSARRSSDLPSSPLPWLPFEVRDDEDEDVNKVDEEDMDNRKVPIVEVLKRNVKWFLCF